MEYKDEDFKNFLKVISEIILDIRESGGVLKYPELTGEYNDMLWTFDGINECLERIQNDCNTVEDVTYYLEKIEQRKQKIENEFIQFLN